MTKPTREDLSFYFVHKDWPALYDSALSLEADVKRLTELYEGTGGHGFTCKFGHEHPNIYESMKCVKASKQLEVDTLRARIAELESELGFDEEPTDAD